MENYTEPNNGEEKGAHLLAHGFWWEIDSAFASGLCK